MLKYCYLHFYFLIRKINQQGKLIPFDTLIFLEKHLNLNRNEGYYDK